jgi:hypothetical protein
VSIVLEETETMRITRLVALLCVLVLPASVVAADYQALRATHPSVGRAVAAMPSSAINGDLNRISSLMNQSRVQAFIANPDRSTEVPSFIDRPLVAALDDLGDDLAWGLSPLDFADTMTIAQVVNLVAVEPTLALYEPPWLPVGHCTVGFPSEDCVPARLAVARIVQLLETKARAEWTEVAARDASLPAQLPPPTDLQPNQFPQWVSQCLDAPGVLASGGAESIDD